LRELRALAQDGFAASTGDVFALASLTKLAAAAVALEDKESASVLRARLAPHAELSALTVFCNSLGSVSRYLGLLELFLGQRARAQRFFERAIERNTQSGHELERLRSSLDLARLLAEGRASERAQARKLADMVGEVAQSFGALALVGAARTLLAGTASQSGSTRAPRGPRLARERT
jgi:hypothetical protein